MEATGRARAACAHNTAQRYPCDLLLKRSTQSKDFRAWDCAGLNSCAGEMSGAAGRQRGKGKESWPPFGQASHNTLSHHPAAAPLTGTKFMLGEPSALMACTYGAIAWIPAPAGPPSMACPLRSAVLGTL